MKLSTTLPLALCAAFACVATASAQNLSIYGTTGLTTFAYKAYSDSLAYKGDTIGFTGGAFYTFPINSRLKPAIDARFMGSAGYKGGEAGLVAFRIAFVPNKNPLRPFFELGGGVISTPSYGYPLNTTTTGGALFLDFGLDIRLSDDWDLRAPEYAGAAGPRTGTGFLAVGVVYHLK